MPRASAEESNAQCTCQRGVHNAQQDGRIKGHWLFTGKPRRNLICLKINKFKETFAPFCFRTRHVIHTYVSFFLAILRWCVYLLKKKKMLGGSQIQMMVKKGIVYSWLIVCKCPEETNPAEK